MSKRLPELYLFDILVAALKIQKVVAQFSNAQQLKYDFVSWDSVVREFEIIGEAMKGLIATGYASEKERAIVDFRNVLIHEYFGIDEEEVWGIAKEHLPNLITKMREMIDEMDSDLRCELVDELMKENRHLPFVIEFLSSLEV